MSDAAKSRYEAVKAAVYQLDAYLGRAASPQEVALLYAVYDSGVTDGKRIERELKRKYP